MMEKSSLTDNEKDAKTDAEQVGDRTGTSGEASQPSGSEPPKKAKVLGIRGQAEDVDSLVAKLKTLNMKGEEQILWLNGLVESALCLQENPQQADEIKMLRGHLDAIMNLMVGSIEVGKSKASLIEERDRQTIRKLQKGNLELQEKLQDATAKLAESRTLSGQLAKLKRENDNLRQDLAAAVAKGKADALKEYEDRTAKLQSKIEQYAETIGRLKAENEMLTERVKMDTGKVNGDNVN